jgi:hypothetical protein
MTWRSSVQNLWRAARAGLARLNRVLAETGNSDDMVFDIRDPRNRRRSNERERIAANSREP